MTLQVKICGLSTEETVEAAVEAGASHVGFVFYPRSPRAVTPARAADLARLVPHPVKICGLFVDAEDSAIERALDLLPLDILQLHGAEPPERCARLRERTRRVVMKAVAIATPEDVRRAELWLGSVDLLLFDAKPPPGGQTLPGGNGIAFDWRLLAGRDWPLPWLLSGGLTADTLRDAVRQTRAPEIDVSSGVETAPGIKDTGLIKQFLMAAKALG